MTPKETAGGVEGWGDLLPAHLLEQVADLEWVSRSVLAAALPGRHGSPLPGGGEDFLRHRPYQLGDDLRHLDWKLFARSDRLQVREFHEAGHLPVMLVVDGSPSMAYQSSQGVSRLRYSAFLAAALARLALSQGDRVGVALPGPDGVVLLPPTLDGQRLPRILHYLDRMEPLPDVSPHGILERGLALLRSPGRVVLFSDLLDGEEPSAGEGVPGEIGPPGPLLAPLALARTRGHEVTVLRLLSPEEEGLQSTGSGRYHDPEDPRVRGVGDPGGDPEYRRRLSGYYRHWRQELAGAGVAMEEAHTGEPPASVLARWLRGEGTGAVAR